MIKKDDCVRTPWSLVFSKIQMKYVDRLSLIVQEKGGNDSYKLDEEIVAIIDILAYKRRK